MHIIRRNLFLTGFEAGFIGDTGSVRGARVIRDNTGMVADSAEARAGQLRVPPGRWDLGGGVGWLGAGAADVAGRESCVYE